jgi:hypothetical protein
LIKKSTNINKGITAYQCESLTTTYTDENQDQPRGISTLLSLQTDVEFQAKDNDRSLKQKIII